MPKPLLTALQLHHETETEPAALATVGHGPAAETLPEVRRRRRFRRRAGQALPANDVVRRTFPIFEALSPEEVYVREGIYRRMLAVADAAAAILALVLVAELLGTDHVMTGSLFAAPLVVIIYKVTGLYERDELRLKRSTLDEAPVLLQLAGLFALTVYILEPWLIEGTLSHAQALALWASVFVLTMGGRVVARRFASSVAPQERCLVIGDAASAAQVREKVTSSGIKATVVATLPVAGDDVRAIGGQEELRRVVRDLDIHRVIIAPVSTDSAAIVELIRIAKAVGVRVSVLPRLFEVVGSAVEFDTLDGLTMLSVRRFGLTRSSVALKRAFDIAVASVVLVAVAPLMALIALLIRMDSRGPIFFRQKRVGRDGKHFDMIKFRSMVDGADRQKAELAHLNQARGGMFKIANDPRITRVGQILRRTSLDELPQLFNVMRGEMSLVGPRPLVLDEDAQVQGLLRSRLHLTPGMTGPWQILGPERVPMQEMLGLDYLYVATWSLWTDVKLLVRTVGHVFARNGM